MFKLTWRPSLITVAILAQGIQWAVAHVQAFYTGSIHATPTSQFIHILLLVILCLALLRIIIARYVLNAMQLQNLAPIPPAHLDKYQTCFISFARHDFIYLDVIRFASHKFASRGLEGALEHLWGVVHVVLPVVAVVGHLDDGHGLP